MSKELWARGEVMGSPKYFQKVNSIEVIGEMTGNLTSYAYFDLLKAQTGKIQSVIDDVYKDLSKAPQILRFIPVQNRNRLLKFILKLDELARHFGRSCNRVVSCKALLTLTDQRTKLKSGARESDIEKAVRLIKHGENTSLSKTDRVSIANKAKTSGVRQAAGGNPKKEAFLTELMQGRGVDFLEDVLTAYMCSEVSVSQHYLIGTEAYIENAEKKVFAKPNQLSFLKNTKPYTELMKTGLENIARKIDDDLNGGLWRGDYLQDHNADNLKNAVSQIEKCGVRRSGLIGKIVKLAWFVGGNPQKIMELQRKLNELRMQGDSGPLLVDGVYGKETLAAWNSFYNKLVVGAVPTLTWVDPLQTNLTGIKSVPMHSKKLGTISSLRDFSSRSLNPKGTTVFRVDFDETRLHHINLVRGEDLGKGRYVLSDSQKLLRTKYNHTKVSERVFNLLKDFDGVAKKIRIGGRVLLVAGVALEALELGTTIDADLKDADKKLGKKTWSVAARIGGRWLGSTFGAKLGAKAGAAAGTAVFPGPGAAIGSVAGGLVLGALGNLAGDKLAEFIIDITITEE